MIGSFILVLLGIKLGIVLTLLVQAFLWRQWFNRKPVETPPFRPQYSKCSLPKALKEAITHSDLREKKESNLCLNLILQFLFNELKDTKILKGFITKRLLVEFNELLQTTAGKFLDEISIRNLNLGEKAPVFRQSSVQSIKLSDDETLIDELNIELDVFYSGGFNMALDVELVFGKSAYLCAKVKEVKGLVRLQFTRVPYTHWSFAFIEEPFLEVSIESQLEGRAVPQLTSLIMNQIRRILKKKHTLPFYKMRYKPFFEGPGTKLPPDDIFFQGKKLSSGKLEVTVIECSRLVKSSPDDKIYCTLALGASPWVDLMTSRIKNVFWASHNIEIDKRNHDSIGLTFKEEYVVGKYGTMIIVENVVQGSVAYYADVRKNDYLISVNNVKVTNLSHAAKLLRQAGDKVSLRIERAIGMNESESKSEEIKTKYSVDSIKVNTNSPTLIKASIDLMRTILPIPKPTDSSTDLAKQVAQSDTSNQLKIDNSTRSFFPSSLSPSRLLMPFQDSQKKTSDKDIKKEEDTCSLNPMHASESSDSNKSSPQGSPRKSNVIIGMMPGSSLFQRGKGKKEKEKDRERSRSPNRSPSMKSKFTPDTIDTDSDILTELQPHAAYEQIKLDSIDSFHSMLEYATTHDNKLYKTATVYGNKHPVFEEKFEIDVTDNDKFLHVCLWCHVPEQRDKQKKIVKPEKDVLLGHVSISLMDIALKCLGTLQGDYQATYSLTPGEMKAAALKAKVAAAATHRGFNESHCYGDVTLGFQHMAQSLSTKERNRIQKLQKENEDRANGAANDVCSEKVKKNRKHDFEGANFQTATYCDFCLKKIWLKYAFKCRDCEMICHKKCIDKCEAQTECYKDGFRFLPGMQGPMPPSKAASKESATSKASLLSRFRKDKNSKESLNVTPPPKRRNSAPDVEEKSKDDELPEQMLGVGSVPRTRSSTSLQDLIQENAPPSLMPEEIYAGRGATLYDSDEEVEFMKLLDSTTSGRSDEKAMTAAKEMGKELFTDMTSDERKTKLDAMINKLQAEIDRETEHRSDLVRKNQCRMTKAQREKLQEHINKSDEKVQSLAILMLHYCAGLQHCMDQMEDGAGSSQSRFDSPRRLSKITGSINETEGDDVEEIEDFSTSQTKNKDSYDSLDGPNYDQSRNESFYSLDYMPTRDHLSEQRDKPDIENRSRGGNSDSHSTNHNNSSQIKTEKKSKVMENSDTFEQSSMESNKRIVTVGPEGESTFDASLKMDESFEENEQKTEETSRTENIQDGVHEVIEKQLNTETISSVHEQRKENRVRTATTIKIPITDPNMSREDIEKLIRAKAAEQIGEKANVEIVTKSSTTESTSSTSTDNDANGTQL